MFSLITSLPCPVSRENPADAKDREFSPMWGWIKSFQGNFFGFVAIGAMNQQVNRRECLSGAMTGIAELAGFESGAILNISDFSEYLSGNKNTIISSAERAVQWWYWLPVTQITSQHDL